MEKTVLVQSIGMNSNDSRVCVVRQIIDKQSL